MSQTRVYCEHAIKVGECFTLDKSSSHHLCTVLRLRPGAKLDVFNGDGNDYQATLMGVGKHAEIRIDSSAFNQTESPLSIHLLQGVSRADRMDSTIQKAVELGVTSITPLFTEKGQVKLNTERLKKRSAHWQSIIVSACEQSHRSVIPTLNKPLKLSDYLSQPPPNDLHSRFVLNPLATILIGDAGQTFPECQLLVGPESGLSQTEISAAHAEGFQSISLGPRILRTETAGPAAIAIIQALQGDLRRRETE